MLNRRPQRTANACYANSIDIFVLCRGCLVESADCIFAEYTGGFLMLTIHLKIVLYSLLSATKQCRIMQVHTLHGLGISKRYCRVIIQPDSNIYPVLYSSHLYLPYTQLNHLYLPHISLNQSTFIPKPAFTQVARGRQFATFKGD